MSVAILEEPRLLHAMAGRLRVHVPAWEGGDEQALGQKVRAIAGVRRAQVNPITGNALILFDPAATTAEAILRAARRIVPEQPAEAAQPDSGSAQPAASRGPQVLRTGKGRARVAVRGLDRDPRLARRVVEHLERRPSVHATDSTLTGRILLEYDEHQADLDDLLAEITGMELPDLPGEDRPAHPLDPAPLVQSAGRVGGAAAGLGLLAARRLLGTEGPPVGGSTPAVAAGMIGIVQGFPATRNGLRLLLGRHVADLLFQGAAIVSLALSGNPLGLSVTGGEALRLLTEVTARRAAWRRYEERLPTGADQQPGATIRLEAGERTLRAARIVEGTGTAVGRGGLPRSVAPGERVSAGSRLHGGPFVVTLDTGPAFTPEPRPAPVGPSLYSRYHQALGPASLIYAGLTAILTRSLGRTFAALLLVTPRTAVIGAEAADLGASARALRAGVIVVGTRPNRPIRRPDLLLLDSARMLTDGWQAQSALPLGADLDGAELLALAAGIAGAAGSPWGGPFPRAQARAATDGAFDGETASATIDQESYAIGPLADQERSARTESLAGRGTYLLAVRSDRGGLLGVIALRPRLAAGAAELVASCTQHGVEIGLLANGGGVAAQMIARRARISLLDGDDAVSVIRARQSTGALVAYAGDSADAGPGFAACDLAIGLGSGRGGRFPARADLLAPDLGAVSAIIEAGARREGAVLDAVALSAVANLAGGVWGLRGAPGIERASQIVYVTALASLASGWLRLRGGRRPGMALAHLTDPRPERWGRRSIAEALRMLDTTPGGLSGEEAGRRRQARPVARERSDLARAVLDQGRSPLTGVLVAAGGLSLVLGSPFDVGLIAATLAVNVAVGAWQERRAGQAAAALERLGAAGATLLRDGQVTRLPATEVVPGDVLVLASGDRVAGDARLIEAHHLEVNEAALTGESLPVIKQASGGADAARVVLEGSDVVVGNGRAVVVAVGRDTRMGTLAAALATDEVPASPLGGRLSRMLRQILPMAAAGGAIVVGSGVLRGCPLLPQLAVGATIALASVPEGLPLLTGVAQAGSANRLAGRRALVRRLAAVEALGRVDIACTDKTGTLTIGHPALTLVADLSTEAAAGQDRTVLPPALRAVLWTAALASPHPKAAGANAHPTDVAIVEGARRCGIGVVLEQERIAEAPFDPLRSFHAAVVTRGLCVKGSSEALLPRCTRLRLADQDLAMDEAARERVRARAEALAARGLRVLMVAEGPADGTVTDPQGLTALGFVGISDPLRPGVATAVRRCRAAGIRTVMLTGDHPATARAIARQIGLPTGAEALLTGAELADLHNGDLDRRLEGVAVLARVTPLDKLRIVESLQRTGHTVAMTGDGVNDAPALRLADVGVAMGRVGTEVARQAADLVLADDDFATLVEALVEGRSFWRNMRRALGLLLGGNLGELGLVVGASLLGMASPLAARQILAVNLITDALPALAVSLQPPGHRDLSRLAREGATALDTPLRNEVLRRGAITTVPALAAFAISLGAEGLAPARTVAFASVVATQLAQTLEAGQAEGGLSRPVFGAVAGSAALLVGALGLPALRRMLLLTLPSPLSLALIGGSTLAALAASRAFSVAGGGAETPRLLTAPRPLRLLPAVSLP